MKLSESVKPISYLKAHASEMLRDLSNNQKTMIITQNGEAKAVLQDIKSYEEMQASLALLKLLSLSSKSREQKKYKTIENAFGDIRNRIEKNNEI